MCFSILVRTKNNKNNKYKIREKGIQSRSTCIVNTSKESSIKIDEMKMTLKKENELNDDIEELTSLLGKSTISKVNKTKQGSVSKRKNKKKSSFRKKTKNVMDEDLGIFEKIAKDVQNPWKEFHIHVHDIYKNSCKKVFLHDLGKLCIHDFKKVKNALKHELFEVEEKETIYFCGISAMQNRNGKLYNHLLKRAYEIGVFNKLLSSGILFDSNSEANTIDNFIFVRRHAIIPKATYDQCISLTDVYEYMTFSAFLRKILKNVRWDYAEKMEK